MFNVTLIFLMLCVVHILLLLLQPTDAQIYITTVSLYKIHSYMFRHLCVILREFCICTLLSYIQFLKLIISLTVQLSITLANNQLDAQIFNTFITIL